MLAISALLLPILASTWAVDLTGFPELEPRQNWGVNFIKVQTVLNGATKYRHTFAVPIPTITYTAISLMRCGKEEKHVHCEAINSMIGEINELLDEEFSRLQDALDLSLKAVPNFDDTTTIDISTNRRVRRDTFAGPNYCKELLAGQKNDEDSGLFGTIGTVWADITGLPTWDDIRVVDKHICQMSDVTKMTRKIIKATRDRMSSMSLTLTNRMDAIENGIQNVNVRVTDTNRQLVRIAADIIKNENILAKRMTMIEATQELLFIIRAELSKVRAHVAEFEEYVHSFIDGIHTLLGGKLPIDLIGFEDVRRVLSFMNERGVTRGPVRLVEPNPGFYYMTENIAFTRSAKKNLIYITMTVPLYDQGGLLVIYRVDQTHIATKEGHLSSTAIHDLPDYLAVSADKLYYTEFSTAHLSSCRGTNVKICATERSLRNFQSPSCAAAIYKDDAKWVMKECDIRYSDDPIPAGAIKLPDFTYLVHSPKAATEPSATWDLNCPGKPGGKKKVPVCSTCFIRVNCGCELIATGEFHIPLQLTGCDEMIKQTSPEVVHRFPVNLPMLHSLFTPDQLKHLTGAMTRTTKWQTEIAPLKKVSQKWTNNVEASEKYSTKLQRLVELNKKETAAYATRADEALQRATDFNDLNMGHLNHLTDTFGGLQWLKALDPKATLGGVSVITILTIISIIMGLYNCWRFAR